MSKSEQIHSWVNIYKLSHG